MKHTTFLTNNLVLSLFNVESQPHSSLPATERAAFEDGMQKTYLWTYNIVSSCNNDFHFDAADALITLFAQRYGDGEMLLKLKELRQFKWSSVHGILN